MYKMVDTINHEILLGTEKAVIKYAQDRFEEDKYWIDDHFWDLKNKGIENGFNNIQGAIKLLELKFVEVVDLGDILTSLNNNEYVSITIEE